MWGKFWDAEQVWSAAGQGSTEGAAVAGRFQGNDSSPRGTIVLEKEKDPVVNAVSQDSWALLSLSLRILFCLTVWGGCQNRGFCVRQAGERTFILSKKELLCLIRRGQGPRQPQQSRRMLWAAQGAGTWWGSALECPSGAVPASYYSWLCAPIHQRFPRLLSAITHLFFLTLQKSDWVTQSFKQFGLKTCRDGGCRASLGNLF